MRLNRTFKTLTLLAAAIIIAVFSCHKPEETVTAREALLSIPEPEVGNMASQQFVSVAATGAWTLDIDFGGAEPWADLDPVSGDGDMTSVVLSWDANEGEARRCTVTLNCGDLISSAGLCQRAAPGHGGPDPDPGPAEITPDTPGKWLELPATDDPELYFITHDMERGGKTVRNYSYYYSPDDKLAVWVAYPLNKGLIGSGSRTDEWGYDPKVPASLQPVLFRGYRGGYDRGHQLPSADRYGSGVNETTFYFTNMTPQEGSLNQNAWANLEGKVRDWSSSMDTLYVVTGADIAGAAEVAYDNDGAGCTVPVGYFKALLGYKKGGSIGNSTGGYIAIGFYFEHRSYDSNQIMNQSMTIDELEEKLGYDFFVNLPDKVGAGVAAQIESEVDSWWKR